MENAVASEHEEQVALCVWLKAKGVPFFAVPNAGKRSYRTASYFRAEGMKRGSPDLILGRFGVHPDWGLENDKRPVAIEMKAEKGILSPEQRDFHSVLRKEGWIVLVCYGYDDAREQLLGLGL